MREPRRLADTASILEVRIIALEEAKWAARTRAERRPINQQLHAAQSLLAWVKTREGYPDGSAD